MPGIKHRNELLLGAGYSSYRLYLKSEIWAQIRKACFLLKGRKCLSCGGVATEIHHSTYTQKNLLEVNLKSMELTLFPVCHECHGKCHFKNGKFRTIKQSGDSIKSRAHGKITKRVQRGRRAMAENVAYQESMLGKHRW